MRFKYHLAEWIHDQKWASGGYWFGVLVTIAMHGTMTSLMIGWAITFVATVIGG